MKKYSLLGILLVLLAVIVAAQMVVEVPTAPARLSVGVVGGGGGAAPSGTPPSFRSVSSAVMGNGPASTITITAPAGIQDGDILVAYLSGGYDVATPALAGWTEKVHGGDGNYGGAIHVLWKRASSESGNYVFTNIDHGAAVVGAIAAFSGAIASGDPIDAIQVYYNTTSSTTVATTSTTTTSANTLVLFWENCYDGTVSGWTGGGLTWTERQDGAPELQLGLATAPFTGSGAISPAVTTTSTSNYLYTSVLMALKP
jgi:hypothetical protein